MRDLMDKLGHVLYQGVSFRDNLVSRSISLTFVLMFLDLYFCKETPFITYKRKSLKLVKELNILRVYTYI